MFSPVQNNNKKRKYMISKQKRENKIIIHQPKLEKKAF